MTQKTALITGVTGQDGAYLAELLLKKGYTVHGIKRRSSIFNTSRIDHLYQDPHVDQRNFVLHYGDLTDSTNLIRIVQETQPDELYNLAAQSHVKVSFETPEYTANSDALGTLRLLEAIRILGLDQKHAFIRPQPRSCMVLCRRPHSERPPRSTPARLTESPNSMATGSPSTIVKPTGCTPATGSSSTTSLRCVGRPLSPARSPGPWHASPRDDRTVSIWEIWMPSVTGGMLETTWTACGASSSIRIRKTSSLQQG